MKPPARPTPRRAGKGARIRGHTTTGSAGQQRVSPCGEREPLKFGLSALGRLLDLQHLPDEEEPRRDRAQQRRIRRRWETWNGCRRPPAETWPSLDVQRRQAATVER